MHSRSLLILLVLLVASLALVLVLRQDEDALKSPTSPLREIDYSSISLLGCENAERDLSWEIKRTADRFELRASDIEATQGEDGRSVRANPEIFTRIIGFLKDAQTISSRRAEGLNLVEWGLSPARLRLRIADSSAVHEIEFGSKNMDGEIYLRKKGALDLFVVDARITSDIELATKYLRDPRLINMPINDVSVVQMARADGKNFSVERVGSTWYVKSPGLSLRGDQAKCKIFVNTLAAAAGQPSAEDYQVETTKASYVKVRCFDDKGVEAAYRVTTLDLENSKSVAVRADESECRRLRNEVARYAATLREELIDPFFVSIPRPRINSLQIEGKSRLRDLRLEQMRNERWRMRFGPVFVWMCDDTKIRDFVHALNVMKTIERQESAPEFEAAFSLKISLKDAQGLPDINFKFSAPNAQGEILATRSDESGSVRMDAEQVGMVMGTPYWDILNRVVAQGSGAAIHALKLTVNQDQTQKSWSLRRKAPEVWAQESYALDGKTQASNPRDIDQQFLSPLLDKLSYLVPKEFVGYFAGEDYKSKMGPTRYEIEWSHPDTKTDPKDDVSRPVMREEKTWTIGRREENGDFLCNCSTFPGLIFRIPGEQLISINDAIRVLSR